MEEEWCSVNEKLNAITEEGRVLNTEQQEICSELRKIKNTYREKQVGFSHHLIGLLAIRRAVSSLLMHQEKVSVCLCVCNLFHTKWHIGPPGRFPKRFL